MANHKSAAKRARQNEKRNRRNRSIRSQVRTSVRAFRAACESGDESAVERLRAAERELRRAVSKGVLHRHQVDRRVSRLARQLNRAKAQ